MRPFQTAAHHKVGGSLDWVGLDSRHISAIGSFRTIL